MTLTITERQLYNVYNCTSTQIEYLRYIVTYARDHNGNSPGLRQSARHFGVSYSTARGHVAELSNKRLLRREDGVIIVEDSVWEPPDYIEA